MATALGRVLQGAGIHRSALGPGGRDMTRLAGGSPELWVSIVEDNGAALDASLAALEEELRRFRAVLAEGDRHATNAFFASGRDWFDGTPMHALTPRATGG